MEEEKPKKEKKWLLDKLLKQGEEYKVCGKNLVKLSPKKMKNGAYVGRGQTYAGHLGNPMIKAYAEAKGLIKERAKK